MKQSTEKGTYESQLIFSHLFDNGKLAMDLEREIYLKIGNNAANDDGFNFDGKTETLQIDNLTPLLSLIKTFISDRSHQDVPNAPSSIKLKKPRKIIESDFSETLMLYFTDEDKRCYENLMIKIGNDYKEDVRRFSETLPEHSEHDLKSKISSRIKTMKISYDSFASNKPFSSTTLKKQLNWSNWAYRCARLGYTFEEVERLFLYAFFNCNRTK
jgi:hypothetical protein